jgi:hypothetical protein
MLGTPARRCGRGGGAAVIRRRRRWPARTPPGRPRPGGPVSCRCMKAGGLLPAAPRPATLLAGQGFHRRRARRHQVPGTAPAGGLRRPRSSGTSDAVPLPGGARSGRAGRPCPRAGRPPGRPPRAGHAGQRSAGRSSRPRSPESSTTLVPSRSACRANRDEPSLQHEALAAGHRIAEQRDHPVIRGQPQRPVRRGELPGPSGLPGSGEPGHQDHRGGARVLRRDGPRPQAGRRRRRLARPAGGRSCRGVAGPAVRDRGYGRGRAREGLFVR